MRTLPILLTALLGAALHAQEATSPCEAPPCFQVASPCEYPVCLYGMQAAVDATRTRGPKVDMKATLTAFLKAHPDAALLLAGQAQGKLSLWAYQGLQGSSLTSKFAFKDFVAFAKVAKTSDPALAGLLLPEPVQTRIFGAKTLVIVPLEGFPKVDFAGLLPTGWTQTLGQKLRVTVVRKIEALNEI